MLELKVTGEAEVRAVAKRLRTYGNPQAIRKELNSGLRDATRPAVLAVKAEARSLPARGPKSTGLRRRMAAATSAQIRTGARNPTVRVRVSRARMGEQAALPKLIDQYKWRHPVYGNTEVWVNQYGKFRWFEKATESVADVVRKEVLRTIDRIERKLAGK